MSKLDPCPSSSKSASDEKLGHRNAFAREDMACAVWVGPSRRLRKYTSKQHSLDLDLDLDPSRDGTHCVIADGWA